MPLRDEDKHNLCVGLILKGKTMYLIPECLQMDWVGSSADYQAAMAYVLRHVEGCIILIDDMIICGSSIEEHVAQIRTWLIYIKASRS